MTSKLVMVHGLKNIFQTYFKTKKNIKYDYH